MTNRHKLASLLGALTFAKNYPSIIDKNGDAQLIINIEALEEACKALEKQIPIKPYVESDGDADGYPVWDNYCPSCNEYLDVYNPKHCWKCGQAIDWSENE